MTVFVEGCEVEEGVWSGHPHYVCDRCGISTIDQDNAYRRCEAVREQQPTAVTSDAGLLGPTGEPFPSGGPKSLGGGWYELPDGTRVQGKEAAEESMQPTSHDEA